VLYAQFKTVKIGSLSYAEDDGKHILGIKTPAVDESNGYCCHVVECGNEVCVCVCMCVCVCVCVCVHVCRCVTCVYIRVYVRMYVYTYTYVCMMQIKYVYTCVYIHT